MMEDSICMEWINKARLYFHPLNLDTKNAKHTQCYQIFWESLNPAFELKDCFDFSEAKNNFFYGGGETETSQWPLNKTNIPFSPFLTGKMFSTSTVITPHVDNDTNIPFIQPIKFQWGRTLSKFFINSLGSAIKIADHIRLHVSVNNPQNNTLCIGAKNSYGYLPIPHLTLNYTICTASDIKTLSNRLADKKISQGVPREEYDAVSNLTNAPLWRVVPEILEQGNQSSDSLLRHSANISALLEFAEGCILLDEHWQKHIGDLEVDVDRFKNLSETFQMISRRGLKIALTIHPFFSTQSKNYVEGLTADNGKMIWIQEKMESKTEDFDRSPVIVPALTYFKGWTSVAVIDVTNENAAKWLLQKVKKLVEKYRIDSLYVELGAAYDFPQHYQFSKPLINADQYKELFLQIIRRVPNVKTIGVSGAVKRPQLPTFVALSPTESSWNGINSVISNMLTLGTAGYPFIIPGSVGGDHSVGYENLGKNNLPDKNLYIRWLQLAHFLPVVQYSILPSEYGDDVMEIYKALSEMRKERLMKYITEAIKEATTKGLPIIRPLWMMDPTDPDCLKASDEFTIGDNVLVAPVIQPNQGRREVYLPKGHWRYQFDGSTSKGQRWLTMDIPQSQILFYTRIGFMNT